LIVVFSQRANADLEAIGDWIARDNPGRAISFVAELRNACEALGANPRIYPLLPGSRTLRKRTFAQYLILYRVRAEVFIVSIWHGARDRQRFR
jgi:toxin ParE1/3/4